MFKKINSFLKDLRIAGMYGKAFGLSVKGRYKTAKLRCDKALSNCDSGHYLYSLLLALKGEIEFELGNVDEARAYLRLVLDNAKNEPEMWQGESNSEVLKRVNYYLNKAEDV